MPDTFQYGDEVYSADGDLVSYVAAIPNGHIVSPLYGDGEEEPRYSSESTYTTKHVSKEPPVEAKTAEIAKLDSQITEKSEQLKTLRQAIAAEEKAAKGRHAELTKWSGMQTLEAFLAGKITHVVAYTNWSGPKIQTFAECFDYFDSSYSRQWKRPDGMKLLTLFGRSKDDVTWKVNEYYDGSGSNTRVFPATSYEQAVEIAKGLWNERLKEFLSKSEENAYPNNDFVELGQKLGCEIPQVLADRRHAALLKAARERVAVSELSLTTNQAELAALEAGRELAKADDGVI